MDRFYARPLVDHNLELKLNAYVVAVAPVLFFVCVVTAKTEAPPGLVAVRWIYTIFSGLIPLWVVAFFTNGVFLIFALYGLYDPRAGFGPVDVRHFGTARQQ